MTPVDRSRRPGVEADPPMRFPRIARQVLDNGVEVRAITHQAVPIVSASVLIRGGSAADPADRPGLTALTTDLLDEGADGRDALAIADEVARIGGELELEVGADAVGVTITMLGRFLPQGTIFNAAMRN